MLTDSEQSNVLQHNLNFTFGWVTESVGLYATKGSGIMYIHEYTRMPAGQKNESEREGRIYTSEPVHEFPVGAHLWFGLLLITADLQVILQHSAPKERKKGPKLLQL